MATQTASRVRHALVGALDLVERLAAEELIAVRPTPAITAAPVLPRRRPEADHRESAWRRNYCDRGLARSGAR